MYVISKTFRLAAAHHLPSLPEGHKCRRPHGHNYEVTVVLCGGLDTHEMVLDYGGLDPFIAYVMDHYDHRDLNELFARDPTAEVLAGHFYELAVELLPEPAGWWLDSVVVAETPNTTATYRPGPVPT
jgi:6-pyruvoyltetrahydropterin/6-carboxytetrahydropterin synthase